MNKKTKIIFLTIVLLIGISTVYAAQTVKITVGDIPIEIPNEHKTGTNKNYSDSSAFKKMYDDYVFSVNVYPNYTKTYINYVGYWLENADSQEKVNIDGRPVIFLKNDNKYQGKETFIIFESQGEIVCIHLPHSHGLTDTGRNMVKSTPDATLSSEEFYTIMNISQSDYLSNKHQQDLIDASYDEGYYEGYDYGYEDGSPKGFLSSMFNRIGL